MFWESRKFTLKDEFTFHQLILSVMKIALLFINVISDSIFFMLLLFCPDKRILADCEAHLVEFKYALPID